MTSAKRERAEAFRQEAAQARGALDAERAARDAADALAEENRGTAFVADDVADAAAAAAAAREARLWNAHVALVEKRDEEAKQLAELVDERDAYEAANRALATRVARLDKEAAERDARERQIADELAAAQRRNTRCKDAVLFLAVEGAVYLLLAILTIMPEIAQLGLKIAIPGGAVYLLLAILIQRHLMTQGSGGPVLPEDDEDDGLEDEDVARERERVARGDSERASCPCRK